MMLSASRTEDLLGKVATFIALSTVGAKWFVVLKFGGLSLEAANVGGLVVLSLGVLSVLLFRQIRSNEIFNLLLVLQVLLLAAFSIHGQPSSIVVMSIANSLVAYAVAMVGTLRSTSVILYAFLSLFFFLAISVVIAGVDFFGGFLEYLQTFNRDRFNFWVMRPIFNAFTSGAQDAEYTTQINNSLSGTFCIFYVIAGAYGVCGDRRMAAVALVSLLVIFVIFSSSAFLVTATMSIVFGVFLIRTVKTMWMFYLLLTGVICLIMLTSLGIGEYLAQNIVSDTASREGRLAQYGEALAVIDERMLFGAGLITANGHSVHNFFLFSFASIGVVGGLLSFLIFALAASISAHGMYLSFSSRDVRPQMLMAVGLPLIFIVRSMFGGAGGLPSGPGVMALGLAIVAVREIREAQRHSPEATLGHGSGAGVTQAG